MPTTPSARAPTPRGRWPYTWLIGAVGLVFLISFAIVALVLVTGPAIGLARAFKIVGLSLNVAGAFTSLAPRAARDTEQIEHGVEMPPGRETVWVDTLLARYGIVIFAVGFIQQLIGNLLG